jgi:cytochrome c-type biogenesis protein
VTAFYKVFDKFKRYFRVVEIAGGVMLVLVGLLITTNYLTIVSGYLSRWFPILNEIG